MTKNKNVKQKIYQTGQNLFVDIIVEHLATLT